ncbi:LysM peptidoglycan-binding domain-containing protein [Tumebacillus algifaecis]|uniref:LysM peptidoglycan-binding domain-containing protein n=1 Tax=Tumebacillus algifaecis TaxID=1214604 RepID=UPI001D13123D|nr:LysM peptidoglycan-binding domain-containing protein [Tumebacillus algifaecis]
MDYTVQPGDSLFAIASRFGVPVETLLSVNRIPDPLRLFVGQHLFIPLGHKVPVSAPGPGFPPPRPGTELGERVEKLERQVERQKREIKKLERRVRRLKRP